MALWLLSLYFLIHEKSRGTEQLFLKIILLYHLVCYITWLGATLDDFQTRPLRQILLFLRNNSLTVENYKLYCKIVIKSDKEWI